MLHQESFNCILAVAHEVGGNYGTRNSSFPEFALVAWAALAGEDVRTFPASDAVWFVALALFATAYVGFTLPTATGADPPDVLGRWAA